MAGVQAIWTLPAQQFAHLIWIWELFTVCLHKISMHKYYWKMVQYVRKEPISQSDDFKFCLATSRADCVHKYYWTQIPIPFSIFSLVKCNIVKHNLWTTKENTPSIQERLLKPDYSNWCQIDMAAHSISIYSIHVYTVKSPVINLTVQCLYMSSWDQTLLMLN